MELAHDRKLLDNYIAAKNRQEVALRFLAEDVLARLDLKKGEVVEEAGGLFYKVDNVSVYVYGTEPRLTLMGNRVYKTGRRPARASSHLCATGWRKVLDTSGLTL